MVGRPTKRTPEREARLLEALRAGNTRKHACQYAGITAETLSCWLERFSEFSASVKKAEGDAIVRAVAQIAKAAQDGTWQAAAWWLERRYPDEYGRRFIPELAAHNNVSAMQVTVLFDHADQDQDLALPGS